MELAELDFRYVDRIENEFSNTLFKNANITQHWNLLNALHDGKINLATRNEFDEIIYQSMYKNDLLEKLNIFYKYYGFNDSDSTGARLKYAYLNGRDKIFYIRSVDFITLIAGQDLRK